MKRVTIKDIAEACNVSKATVSYVVNGKLNKVSPEMVKKITAMMEKMEYVPSLSAKSLAGKGSKLIGVVIPQVDVTQKMIFDNPFYSEFLSGLEYYLRQAGYSIVLSVINRDNCFEDMMKKWNLDGAVVFGIDNEEMVKALGNQKMPILLIDSYTTNRRFYRMNLRDEEASFVATTLLVEEGQKNIALVTGKVDKSILLQRRLSGYKSALEQHHIPFDPKLVFEGDVTYEYGVQAANEIMGMSDITGIIATADILALGILNQMQASGKNIPNEYSIVGFDDTYQAKMMYPKLTTIGQNISRRGELAGELILKIIHGEQTEKEYFMDFEVLLRETTRKRD
ncbi:LacI family DNA-binding transcriptional regulator [Faecalicatena contorta]|uniref:Transcriptional regulator, LacI family n=1 Tax=Faecalicatena contorta TaxID=39482 RepID=A0A315ZZX7_9FIRM|nr:LacI family DNA-binding transcriptional regulator [Faecalicatena contorta]PWJ50488.1 LacI family transcriptional regulator [Faecalicatena contorta]SUQ13896.1 transcriptional regulator, LacI family [Faecalicatena contorta]